jgi:hypothetical protein
MQLIDNNSYISHCHRFLARQSQDRAEDAPVDIPGRLLVLLSSGLLITAGPDILNTMTQATLTSVRILLEICHFGLVAYRIFGR